MKNNNLIIVIVLGVIAFLFFRNSATAKYTETGKTVGLTPDTNNTVSDIIKGLTDIFGSRESAYTYNTYE